MKSPSSSDHAVVARLLLPDDANPAGNVHGGTILRLMEEAGMIAATRYLVSHSTSTLCIAALVRFENMSFHQSMFVGEVASLSAHVVFTSPHSVLVKVAVTAEDLSRGKARITNSGELWYVPLVAGENNDWKNPIVTEAPQLSVPTDGTALEEYNQAKQSYESRKQEENILGGESAQSIAECLNVDGCLCLKCREAYEVNDGRTPAESKQELCQMVLPGDCGPKGVAFWWLCHETHGYLPHEDVLPFVTVAPMW